MYPSQPQTPRRVLVADDDPVIRRWLTSILESEGYQVVSVSDGREVYRMLQSDANFKAAVLDLSMPYLEGPDLIRHMRSEKRLMRIPVMLITAESQLKLLASGLAAGATVLLPKPFTSAQLRQTLSMMIGIKAEGGNNSLPPRPRKAGPPIHTEASGANAQIEEPHRRLDGPIDLQVLMSMEDGEDEEASGLLTELIDLYLESAQGDVAAIKRAADEHDDVSVKQRVHALKGSSLTIGARRIASLCEQFEANESSHDATEDFARKLENEFAATKAALEAERSEESQLAFV